ncbi:MAG: tetratricopeptide repeat protein, partial [Myxococcota bacterium]|nr:tetratricopeptide repeat protein [Myxococcota bacterium]
NQLPEASKALYALIEIDPGNQEIHLLLAQLLEQQNDVQGALAIYKKMDSSSSQSKEHRSTIAQLELETKNPKLAKALLSDGELPHDTLSTKILKAKNAGKTGQWSTALGIYQDLYEEHPSNQALLVLYTQALAKAGKSPKAIELLKAAVKNDTPTLQLELGRLYLTGEQWKLSQKAYEKAAQHQRTKVDAYLGLANLAYALNDAPHEIQFLKQALQWDPQHLHARISLGKAQHAQGQYPQARQSYNKALKQAPNNEKIYYLLGFTWERLGQKERALSAFKKALKLKPDFKEAKSAIEKRQSP